METTTSISKGVFVFQNGFEPQKTTKKEKQIIQNNNIYANELWYESYEELWHHLENKIKKVNNEIFSKILANLLNCVKDCYNEPVNETPAITLLTGINMPDNSAQFSALSDDIKDLVTPHVATLHAQDCATLKLLMENIVSQFMNDDERFEDEGSTKKIRKSLCTFSLLKSWYMQQYCSSPSRHKKNSKKPLLIVILPEFERFPEKVVQDFILIASLYINILPLVLIFGVATSPTALHKTLPHQVSSKLNIHIFNSHPSTDCLNNILENVLLSDTTPFNLGGKAFTLFCDVFLFYDFSVQGFIQNFKFAMLQHYSQGNAMALCTYPDNIDNILKVFKSDDFELVRRLMSFRKFVENQDYHTRIDLLENDKCFKKALKNELKEFRKYLFCFKLILKLLGILVIDLPRAPLGKQFRELYAVAVSRKITDSSEYKECIQLLNFLSKDKLIIKVSKICDVLKRIVKNNTENDIRDLKTVLETLLSYLIEIREADFNVEEREENENMLGDKTDRATLKMKLLTMSKQNRKQNNYEKVRERLINEFRKIFEKFLDVPDSKTFHEIYFFNNVGAIKNHIVGSHRAAIHTALNNPHFYLQCNCCILPSEFSILPSMPDICIIYKLHLECGKLINLYDWLQAFVTIINPATDDKEHEITVDPKLQARFTKAVAELEFLGFVKSSKRKTDHVMRLTWGG